MANAPAATTKGPTPALDQDRFAALRQSASWKIALAPHAGSEKLDEQIRKAQDAVHKLADPRPQLERLGWLYVAKARASHDPGFYKLAEHSALALQAYDAKRPDALLLLGHIAQSLHRFKEAEVTCPAPPRLRNSPRVPAVQPMPSLRLGPSRDGRAMSFKPAGWGRQRRRVSRRWIS